MAFGARKIVETPDGVYRPVHMAAELFLAAIFLPAIAGLAFFAKLQWPYAALYITLISLQLIRRLMQRRKYGPLGRPSASIVNGRLYIDRPADSRGGISIELMELKRLIVYGPLRRRTYRIVRIDGTWSEVIPMWKPDVERHAIEFLQRALPDRVTVEEPQTEFALIRGDGPVTHS